MEKTTTAPPRVGPKLVFETPHYEVSVARLSEGPDGKTPLELLIRYFVVSKDEPVVFGTTSSKAEAIAACLAAEASLIQVQELIREQESRGYRASESMHSRGGLGLPDLK